MTSLALSIPFHHADSSPLAVFERVPIGILMVGGLTMITMNAPASALSPPHFHIPRVWRSGVRMEIPIAS